MNVDKISGRVGVPDALVLIPGPCRVGSDGAELPPLPDGWLARPLEPGPGPRRVVLLDSWPWHAWRSGRIVLAEGPRRHLLERNGSGAPVETVEVGHPPGLSGEPWPFREPPPASLGQRALAPCWTTAVDQAVWRLADPSGRPVGVRVEHCWHQGPRTLGLARIDGEVPLPVPDPPPGPGWEDAPSALGAVMAEASLRPRTWSTKASLGPARGPASELPAHAAALAALRSLVARARQVEPGVIHDIDAEFLHDHRVLLRRARSVLSVTRGVFDRGRTGELQALLKGLCKATNRLRDLDVHLAQWPEQQARVPEDLRPALGPIRASIEGERGVAQRQVAEAMAGADHASTLRRVEACLGSMGAGAEASRPLGDLAAERLHRALERVLEAARGLDTQTTDEQLHGLRIRCKKLRYALELFSGAVERRVAANLIRRLERLQDVLGAFNDRRLQAEEVRAWVLDRPGAEVSTVLAVGALYGALDGERRRLRAEVFEAVERFDTPRLRALAQSATGRPSPGP